MSLELLATLEAKIQITLETMELLNLEIEEEKQRNSDLLEENKQLLAEQKTWNDKVVGLVDLLREDTAQNAGSLQNEESTAN
jgi:cell division protein ZapB